MKNPSRGMQESGRRRWPAVLLAAAAVLIALPGLAQADRDRDRDRGRDRHAHAHHARVPVVHHGAACASRHPARAHGVHHAWRHPRQPARSRHVRHVAHPYECRPCASRFGSWAGLRDHVHRHHRVSPWRLSRLLVRHGDFWIFVG